MLQIRQYEPGDAAECDRLLEFNRHGEVLLAKDRILVCDRGDKSLAGLLVWRPGAIVHELVIDRARSDMISRSIASNLVARALQQAATEPMKLHEGVFVVGPVNERMVRFCQSIGAKEEVGRLFCRPITS